MTCNLSLPKVTSRKPLEVLRMKLTAETIRAYFETHKIDFSILGAESLLDFIYQCYSEFHSFDNEQIRACLADLEHFHDALPIEESDQLFNLVADLCIEYERAAFTEGIHVGVQLMAELRA